MIIHDVVQGTEEWTRLRMGMPTASNFDRIVTPGGKLSASSVPYMHCLIAELIIGEPLEGPTGMPWMERGKDLEAEAVEFYEFHRDVKTVPVGFITNNERTYGASPDRLVGDDGAVEIKCPKPEKHVEYLLMQSAPKDYKPQVQGQLLVSGRAWVDICSYHPLMPPAIVRVQRDAEFIQTLTTALDEFVARFKALCRELIDANILKETN